MCAALTFIPGAAEATIDSVTVNSSRDYGNVVGYTYSEITIRGSIARPDGSVGQYSVPAVIIYPQHRRGEGVGVVDWLNSAFYHFFPPLTEFGTFQCTLLATGNFLFEEGYTYVSIQWNKAVTEIFGSTAPDDSQPHNHLLLAARRYPGPGHWRWTGAQSDGTAEIAFGFNAKSTDAGSLATATWSIRPRTSTSRAWMSRLRSGRHPRPTRQAAFSQEGTSKSGDNVNGGSSQEKSRCPRSMPTA